jgi:hypothetical protein
MIRGLKNKHPAVIQGVIRLKLEAPGSRKGPHPLSFQLPDVSIYRRRTTPDHGLRRNFSDEFLHLGRRRALGSLLDFKSHAIALPQRLEALALDGGVVDKNILSVFFFDEPEPLFLVEPLDDTFRHTLLLPIVLLTFHAPLKQKKQNHFWPCFRSLSTNESGVWQTDGSHKTTSSRVPISTNFKVI